MAAGVLLTGRRPGKAPTGHELQDPRPAVRSAWEHRDCSPAGGPAVGQRQARCKSGRGPRGPRRQPSCTPAEAPSVYGSQASLPAGALTESRARWDRAMPSRREDSSASRAGTARDSGVCEGPWGCLVSLCDWQRPPREQTQACVCVPWRRQPGHQPEASLCHAQGGPEEPVTPGRQGPRPEPQWRGGQGRLAASWALGSRPHGMATAGRARPAHPACPPSRDGLHSCPSPH